MYNISRFLFYCRDRVDQYRIQMASLQHFQPLADLSLFLFPWKFVIPYKYLKQDYKHYLNHNDHKDYQNN